MSEKKSKKKSEEKIGGFTINIKKILESHPNTAVVNVLYKVNDGEVEVAGMELLEEQDVKPETIN